MEDAKAQAVIFSVEAHLRSIAPSPREAKRLIESVPDLTLTLDYTHFAQGLARYPGAPADPLRHPFSRAQRAKAACRPRSRETRSTTRTSWSGCDLRDTAATSASSTCGRSGNAATKWTTCRKSSATAISSVPGKGEAKLMKKLMRTIVLLASSWVIVAGGFRAQAAGLAPPVNLRCEYLADPLGIDVLQPRLSWRFEWPGRGQSQTAYRLLVASGSDLLAKDQGDLWDSGKVRSGDSIQLAYAGKELKSGMSCYWKVQAWDASGRQSRWSKTAIWSMGLLKPEDWKAKWIGMDGGEEEQADLLKTKKPSWIWLERGAATSAPAEARYFRRIVFIPGGRQIARAVCQMTADDGFTLLVNGQEAARGAGHPNAVSVDLAAKLHPGANVLSVAAFNSPGPPQNPAGLLGALCVEFVEGAPLVIVTDAGWRASAPQHGRMGEGRVQRLGLVSSGRARPQRHGALGPNCRRRGAPPAAGADAASRLSSGKEGRQSDGLRLRIRVLRDAPQRPQSWRPRY